MAGAVLAGHGRGYLHPETSSSQVELNSDDDSLIKAVLRKSNNRRRTLILGPGGVRGRPRRRGQGSSIKPHTSDPYLCILQYIPCISRYIQTFAPRQVATSSTCSQTQNKKTTQHFEISKGVVCMYDIRMYRVYNSNQSTNPAYCAKIPAFLSPQPKRRSSATISHSHSSHVWAHSL